MVKKANLTNAVLAISQRLANRSEKFWYDKSTFLITFLDRVFGSITLGKKFFFRICWFGGSKFSERKLPVKLK